MKLDDYVILCFRLVERVRRTVRGSSDDIGWLQSAPEMPAVEDGTDRFSNILEIIRYIETISKQNLLNSEQMKH